MRLKDSTFLMIDERIELAISRIWDYGVNDLNENDREEILLPVIRAQTRDALVNPHIRSFIDKLSVNPDEIPSLELVPWVPVTMFKEFDLATVPADDIVKILRSSGTTSQQTSKIPLDKVTIQNQNRSLSKILANYLGPKRLTFIVIDHPEINDPRNEFSARTAGVRGLSLYARKIIYLLKKEGDTLTVNPDALLEIEQLGKNTPVYLFGFTWIIWSVCIPYFRKHDICLNLSDATLFHGGGWKNLHKIAVGKDFFAIEIQKLFGIPSNRILDFYGMAEQTGIIFPDCECGFKHVPSCAKIIIRNIQTLKPCDIGERGLIEVMSILPVSYYGQALLTEDTGRIIGLDGCHCGRRGMFFEFLNRVERAEIRGCGDTFRMDHGR